MTSLILVIAMLFLVPVAALLMAEEPQQKLQAQETLYIYFIDTDGVQSTLFAPPSGESLLLDTGTSDGAGTQVGRIMASIKKQASSSWITLSCRITTATT